MVISTTQPDDILRNCRNALNLPDCSEQLLDDVLIAALIRRAAGISCPCSRKTLTAQVLSSLRGMMQDKESLKDKIEYIIERLIVIGDLLELKDVTTEDIKVKSTWVFAAPPSFIARQNGTTFVLGVVKDYETFLPDSLEIIYDGFKRFIQSDSHDKSDLEEFGLQEMSEATWLKCPNEESARDFFSKYERQLLDRGESGTIEGLRILDTSKPVKFYKSRWGPPQNQTGTYIARRPQEFVNDSWCLVELQEGKPKKLLDLPGEGESWRPCDVSWHIQMAIDKISGAPQIYKTTPFGSDVRFDFFSPIPQWAERRLLIFGDSMEAEKCLFSHALPAIHAEVEVKFLQSHLWMQNLNG